MRVNTNSIGNYFLQRTQNLSKTTPQKSIQKTGNTNSIKQPISAKEKALFAKMYPDKKSEIMEYHYYQKNGVMAGVTVGSLFDRRG